MVAMAMGSPRNRNLTMCGPRLPPDQLSTVRANLLWRGSIMMYQCGKELRHRKNAEPALAHVPIEILNDSKNEWTAIVRWLEKLKDHSIFEDLEEMPNSLKVTFSNRSMNTITFFTYTVFLDTGETTVKYCYPLLLPFGASLDDCYPLLRRSLRPWDKL